MEPIKNTFLNNLCFRNIFFCLLLTFLIFISGCSTKLVLLNANVNLKPKAILTPKQSTFFIDYIEVPRMFKERIGKKRNHVGNFLAWIYTDQKHLEKWCQTEWKIFLNRHGNSVIHDFDKADYIVKCTIVKIWTEKKWKWMYDDEFASHIRMNVKITERSTAGKVFNKNIKYDFNTNRAFERNSEINDEQMFNYCLSVSFQNALEKIKLAPQ